jgi:hypothetical protein
MKKRINNKYPIELLEYEYGGEIFNTLKSLAPIVSMIPGVGTAVGAVMGGIGSVGGVVSNTLSEKDQLAEQQRMANNQQMAINGDPRLRRLASGGSLVQMPQSDGNVDSIPTDAQGNPATVSGQKAIAMTDSGEVIWNGYVFSDKLGFAPKAKTILKRYKLRGGDDFSGLDRISKTQMDREFADLADEQETYKESSNIQDGSDGYVSGGQIKINPSKVGSFTSAANRRHMGVQEFASHVMANKDRYSVSMIKKANFARNASNFKKGEFGLDLNYIENDPKKPYNNGQYAQETALNDIPFLDDGFRFDASSGGSKPMNMSSAPIDTDKLALVGNLAMAGAQGITTLASRQKSFMPTSYNVEEMNLEMERDALQRQAVTSKRSILNRYRNSRSAQIAGVTGVDEQLANSMAKSYTSEEQYNTQAINRQRELTAQSSDKMRELQESERGGTASSISNMIGNAGGALNQYFTDKSKRAQDINMLKVASDGSHYLITTDENGKNIAIKVK